MVLCEISCRSYLTIKKFSLFFSIILNLVLTFFYPSKSSDYVSYRNNTIILLECVYLCSVSPSFLTKLCFWHFFLFFVFLYKFFVFSYFISIFCFIFYIIFKLSSIFTSHFFSLHFLPHHLLFPGFLLIIIVLSAMPNVLFNFNNNHSNTNNVIIELNFIVFVLNLQFFSICQKSDLC